LPHERIKVAILFVIYRCYRGLKSDADCLSEFLTLHDESRQQASEKDRFRQADEAAADLRRGRHRLIL